MERTTYLRTAVIYQMFLRAFDERGTIRAATEHLGEIAALGADIIYLCPFVQHDSSQDPANFSERMKKSGLPNPRNPYRLSDYYQIDPEYGCDADFEAFVKQAHALGMRVMMDLVYLHCGPAASFLVDHPNFARHNEDGSIMLTSFGFPILDFTQPDLREYLLDNMLYFVRRFDIDGYRCDCGDMIPLDFWAEGVRRIRAERPDFVMLNEGDHFEALEEVFDLNYGSPWLWWMTEHLRGRAGAEKVRDAYRRICMPDGISCRNILSLENHDYVNDAYDDRIEKTVPVGAIEGAFLLTALLPGTMFLYNGEEYADTARHSIMGCRENAPGLCIDRSRVQTAEAQHRYAFLRTLIGLRHTLPVVREGDFAWRAEESEALVFERNCGGQTLFAAANLTREKMTVAVPNPTENAKILLQREAVLSGSSLILPPHSYMALLWE